MNGGPMPPDPTAPPDWILFVLFLVGTVFVFTWIFVIGALEQRKQKRVDAEETLAQALAQEKEQLENFKIQALINQSPGGRKPWQ